MNILRPSLLPVIINLAGLLHTLIPFHIKEKKIFSDFYSFKDSDPHNFSADPQPRVQLYTVEKSRHFLHVDRNVFKWNYQSIMCISITIWMLLLQDND